MVFAVIVVYRGSIVFVISLSPMCIEVVKASSFWGFSSFSVGGGYQRIRLPIRSAATMTNNIESVTFFSDGPTVVLYKSSLLMPVYSIPFHSIPLKGEAVQGGTKRRNVDWSNALNDRCEALRGERKAMQVTFINEAFDCIIIFTVQYVLVVYFVAISRIFDVKEQHVSAAKSKKITVMSSERPWIVSHKPS